MQNKFQALLKQMICFGWMYGSLHQNSLKKDAPRMRNALAKQHGNGEEIAAMKGFFVVIFTQIVEHPNNRFHHPKFSPWVSCIIITKQYCCCICTLFARKRTMTVQKFS
jgi:hypothetical protein